MTSEQHTDFTLTWQRIGCCLMKGPRERADRVAEVPIGYKTSAELEAIGSRMAAAWNACAGIPTETLEGYEKHGGIRKLAPTIIREISKVDGFEDAQARADALAARLATAETAFETIAALKASGPHMSAKDGMSAALTALNQARDLAREFLEAKP